MPRPPWAAIVTSQAAIAKWAMRRITPEPCETQAWVVYDILWAQTCASSQDGLQVVRETCARPFSTRRPSKCYSSMEKILDRYERYSYAERALFSNEADPQADWCLEYSKLKTRVESLQKSQRHLMGEQLDSLSIKELQHLEQQLENSLKRMRSRKTQLMLDSIAELQKKEKMLQEQNKNMEKEIVAKDKARALAQKASYEQQNKPQYSSSPPQVLMPDFVPTLTCRNYQARGNEEEAPQPQLRLGNVLPPWMLSHMNG